MNKYFLSQYIDVKTRGENILDLCMTNNDRLAHHTTTEKHELSDDNVVEIMVPITEFITPNKHKSLHNQEELKGFNAINLFRANFDAISAELE